MRIEDGGPAFPRPCSEERTDGDQPDGNATIHEQDGMSLRDYFAAAALNGMCAGTFQTAEACAKSDTLAKNAYLVADAMLAARQPKREYSPPDEEGELHGTDGF